jgi:hypothetical protein
MSIGRELKLPGHNALITVTIVMFIENVNLFLNLIEPPTPMQVRVHELQGPVASCRSC